MAILTLGLELLGQSTTPSLQETLGFIAANTDGRFYANTLAWKKDGVVSSGLFFATVSVSWRGCDLSVTVKEESEWSYSVEGAKTLYSTKDSVSRRYSIPLSGLAQNGIRQVCLFRRSR